MKPLYSDYWWISSSPVYGKQTITIKKRKSRRTTRQKILLKRPALAIPVFFLAASVPTITTPITARMISKGRERRKMAATNSNTLLT
jgi:hypothetical protein